MIGTGFGRATLGWTFGRGLLDRVIRLQPASLTALCYHRIQDFARDQFQGFVGNISASPEDFENQIRYLCQNFDPISVSDLDAVLSKPCRLSRRPVLVTFDDGYRDNGEIAWPILRRWRVPAVVFLATDFIGGRRPFPWDQAAFCFHTTARIYADIPLLGARALRTPEERHSAAAAWIHASKKQPAADRTAALEQLHEALGVEIAPNAFRNLVLSWRDVRRLAAQGLTFGGHTQTHPILSRASLDGAHSEIAGCRARIERILGRPPVAFAYPNGSRRDFTHEHEHLVREAGYRFAFTTEPGPISLAVARQRPLALGRICVSLRDDMPRFVAKLAGAARVARSPVFRRFRMLEAYPSGS